MLLRTCKGLGQSGCNSEDRLGPNALRPGKHDKTCIQTVPHPKMQALIDQTWVHVGVQPNVG